MNGSRGRAHGEAVARCRFGSNRSREKNERRAPELQCAHPLAPSTHVSPAQLSTMLALTYLPAGAGALAACIRCGVERQDGCWPRGIDPLVATFLPSCTP